MIPAEWRLRISSPVSLGGCLRDGVGLDVFPEVIAYGAPEQTYENGHCAEYCPRQDMSVFIIFYAIESETGESGESSAESGHSEQWEGCACLLAPVAINIDDPSGEDAYKKATQRIYHPCGEAHRGVFKPLLYEKSAYCSETSGEGYQSHFNPYIHLISVKRLQKLKLRTRG